MPNLSDTPLPRLMPRDLASHKGNFGHALLVGGSRSMPGAVAMAGIACLRAGAGLVTVATPESAQPIVAGYCPAYMTRPLVEDDYGITHWANAIDLEHDAEKYDALAIGPGLGSPEEVSPLVGRIYASWLAPMVVDADGLNAISLFDQTRSPLLSETAGPRVLTPHPGEFTRLANDAGLAAMATGGDDQRIEAASELANRDNNSQTVVVLKGHRTVISDGLQWAINTTGNPGMATGGSGDVLTGVITALLCQGLAPFDAARLGAHVHGIAADLAAGDLGQVSLIATDLIEYLPKAFVSLEA